MNNNNSDMKKIFFALALCLVALGCSAQLLWKVSGDQLARPSYLFGTYHLISGNFIDSVAGLPEAIKAVDAVYVEIENDSIKSPQSLAMLAQAMLAPEDSTLDKLLSPAGYKIVENVIDKYFGSFGIGMEPFLKLKPAAIANQLMVLQASRIIQTIDPNNLIDAAVEKRVTSLGKPVHSLENVAIQAKIFFGSPLVKQAADLMEMCKADNEVNAALNSITQAYTQQDLGKVLEVMENPAIGGNKEDLETLFYSRNRNWKEIIIPAMQEQSIMVSVGAGHLPSENGLINLLRQAGLTVEPVSN